MGQPSESSRYRPSGASPSASGLELVMSAVHRRGQHTAPAAVGLVWRHTAMVARPGAPGRLLLRAHWVRVTIELALVRIRRPTSSA